MKPILPAGFRDLTPPEVARRNQLLHVIREWFHRYNFVPIETPAVELTAVLEGKYGQEGEKLLFRILKNADELQRQMNNLSPDMPLHETIQRLSNQALRYDLTVPLARYIAMHKNDIRFPFKRYQIQPVWRGERPQRGRYREFLQCDADIVGAPPGIADAEVITLALRVFEQLGIPFRLHLNDRRLLHVMAIRFDIPPNSHTRFIITLDKLDKIGAEAVTQLLQADGILNERQAAQFQQMIRTFSNQDTPPLQQLQQMSATFKAPEVYDHLQRILHLIPRQFHHYLRLNLFLARGLDYYTSTIFEVTAPNTPIGSIAGGGRYDQLGEVFGLRDAPAIGISFGIDRILDVMEYLRKPLSHQPLHATLLVANLDPDMEAHLFQVTETLRMQGYRIELFSRPATLKKQLRYAQQTGIPYVLIIFPEDLPHQRAHLKELSTGRQTTVTIKELSSILDHE